MAGLLGFLFASSNSGLKLKDTWTRGHLNRILLAPAEAREDPASRDRNLKDAMCALSPESGGPAPTPAGQREA